uniref:PBPe domain-containing protein n=1 Tax=Hymenolepis diminuta TaxID=6216 RepID=A0A158QDX6_HYMDI
LDSGKGYGVATPPGSDLRDRLNLAVLELKEMDWIAQLYRTWWEERGECGKASTSTDINSATSSLGLDSVYGLFYLLAGALVIGIALSILEFIYRCAVEAKRSRRSFTEVFCDMARLAIGKTGVRMDIPLMLYQSPENQKGDSQQDEVVDGNKREAEESEVDQGCVFSPSSPSPPPPPTAVPHAPQRNPIEAFYLNTPKWRARRDEIPEKIDYYL